MCDASHDPQRALALLGRTTRGRPQAPSENCLLLDVVADAEALDEGAVLLDVVPLDVREKTTALADEHAPQGLVTTGLQAHVEEGCDATVRRRHHPQQLPCDVGGFDRRDAQSLHVGLAEDAVEKVVEPELSLVGMT